MQRRWVRKFLLLIGVIFMAVGLNYFSDKDASLHVQEGPIPVQGGELWFQIHSTKKTENKPPLLILHGGPGIPHNYLKSLSALGTDRPVIFYDQLGCGRSHVTEKNAHSWQLSDYVRDLEALVEHLGLKHFILFGHSFGGALATEYASKNSDKIIGLVLASPLLNTKLWIQDTKRLLKQLPQDVQEKILYHEQQGTTDSHDYQEASKAFNATFLCRLNPLPQDVKDALNAINFDIYKTMWGPSEFTVTGHLKDFDGIDHLCHLNIPILLTCGRFDEATPETLERIGEKLQKSQLVIFEKSAHLPHVEEPELYLQALKHFFQTLESSMDK